MERLEDNGLVKVWRNGNPSTSLVGMQKGAASVANSWTVPQKFNIESPCDSAILIVVIHSEELKAGTQTDTYTPMCVAVLFTVTKGWRQPKCSLSDERINKMQCTHTAQHYSPLKGIESLTPVMTLINLEDIVW